MSDQGFLDQNYENKSFLQKYKVHIIVSTVVVLLWVGSCLLLYFTLRPTTTINTIKTDLAPQALGSYSSARSFGDLIYISGQIGVNPSTNELVSDNISQQARQAMTNLKNIAEAGGSNMNRLLTTTIYLNGNFGQDQFVKYFKLVDGEYQKFFDKESFPARATVAVKQLPLKQGKQALVQISAVAVKG